MAADAKLVAADAKLNFDDNAAFRQKSTFALRDSTQEDPREVCMQSCVFYGVFCRPHKVMTIFLNACWHCFVLLGI